MSASENETTIYRNSLGNWGRLPRNRPVIFVLILASLEL